MFLQKRTNGAFSPFILGTLERWERKCRRAGASWSSLSILCWGHTGQPAPGPPIYGSCQEEFPRHQWDWLNLPCSLHVFSPLHWSSLTLTKISRGKRPRAFPEGLGVFKDSDESFLVAFRHLRVGRRQFCSARNLAAPDPTAEAATHRPYSQAYPACRKDTSLSPWKTCLMDMPSIDWIRPVGCEHNKPVHITGKTGWSLTRGCRAI